MTSWFVGFAPSRNPEIVVSVMLVNGHTYRARPTSWLAIY
jgi:cell division protein FtsI/penicillin-binding protein 2